ncbi:MAG TPA: lysylphosphatidylglycerol synthase transmembrane domain-containing protein [Polyangiaceae bacterium]|nr:lysylphosphatidylglycerol synthase transmembrane domain-containing protein [Polyangiaceae bacterium]
MDAPDQDARGSDPEGPEPGTTSAAPRWRRWLWRGALTAAMVVLILWQVPPGDVLATLLALDGRWLALAVALTVAVNALKPLRWLWILRAAAPAATYWQALASLLVAASARLVIPGKAGEYGRVVTLRGLSLKSALGLTTVDLLLEMYTGLLCALPAAFVFGGLGGGLAVTAVTGVFVAACHWPDRALRGTARLLGSSRLRRQALAAQVVMAQLPWGTLARAVVLTLLLHGVRFAQLAGLLIGLGVDSTWLAWVCLPVVQLADAFPITVAGVGPREWVGLHVLPAVAIAPAVAVTAVLVQSLVSGFVPGAAGLGVLLWGGGRGREAAAGSAARGPTRRGSARRSPSTVRRRDPDRESASAPLP